MRVLCYYPWIYLRSGIERTILEHAKRSKHDIIFATNCYDRKGTFPDFENLPVVQLPLKVSVKRAFGSVFVAACKIITSKLNNFDYDVLLVHCDGLGNLVLFANHQKPAICFCHTPLRIAFDPVYISKNCEGKKFRKPLVNVIGKFYRFIDLRACEYYDYIFFNSKEVRNRYLRSGLSSKSSSILHPGIDEKISPSSTSRELFFLCAGRIMWTKNIEGAILGFKEAKLKGYIPEEMKLVIAGMVDEKSIPYIRNLKFLAGDKNDIRFIETPSDKVLFDLYKRCFAVIFPAFNEDWGIIPIESMQFGKVVISSKFGGPKESIINGETGWLINPDKDGIVEGISKCYNNKNKLDLMSKKCINRAKEFTWEKFTFELDNMIDAVHR
jgi:glycosyltransferase involved in cell wall biosynthesis